MSDTNFEMGKKRTRQSSNATVASVDSSESGDRAADKNTSNKQICTHVAKSIDNNQKKKNSTLYINGKKICVHCKEGNEDSNEKGDGNEGFWICLRCNARTCSLEHSSHHYDVPRSDSHALTLKIPAFSVWCHACKAEIPSGYSNKLKTCVNSVEQLYNKQTNLQTLSQRETKSPSKSNENDEIKEKKSNEAIPLPPPKTTTPNTAPAVRGLTNLGNTCFFNSVLQCLAQTPGLIDAIREMESPNQSVDIALKSGDALNGKLDQWDRLSESLANTLKELQSGGPVVSPDRLLSLLVKEQAQFQGYRQHDAHELFTYLIDSVRMADHKRYKKLILSKFNLYGKQDYQDVPEETKKKLKALYYEIADMITFAPEKVFKGQLVNRIECQECRSVKTFEESFLDLSLPIVPDKPQPPCMRRKGGGHQQYVQNQSDVETIQEENKTANNASNTVSKGDSKKERRSQYKKNRKQGKNIAGNYPKKEDNSPAGLVEEDVSEVGKEVTVEGEQQESDVEGDVEDNSEETNCGSKKSNLSKGPAHIGGGDTEVNCGNEGVWVESNESSSSTADKEKLVKQDDTISNQSSPLVQKEEESNTIAEFLGVEQLSSTNLEVRDKGKQCVVEEVPVAASSSFYIEECNVSGVKTIDFNEQQKSNNDAQVTAWLNTSNLVNVPDNEEADISPPLSNDNHGEISGLTTTQNRLSPQAQTSVCSNHQSSHPSLDETRSSFLTGTQETQESGYCSEKLGCPESPQREASPCSLDGLSPAWSGVEGAVSSRSDVSIEEVFNNAATAILEEDESTETTEIAANSFNKASTEDSGTTKVTTMLKSSAWMRNCHPPAHVRRRAISPPADHNSTTFQVADDNSSTIDSTMMCTKWLEENSRLPAFDDKEEVLQDVPGNRHDKNIGNCLGDIYERELRDIPEEESEVVYGPLTRDELLLSGDLEVSDSNSNDLCSTAQGLIARPGSPCEDDNQSSDFKNLEINTINIEEDSLPEFKKEINIHRGKDEITIDKVSEALNGRNIIGAKDVDLSCGCNRTQRHDSTDSYCLHTSLAQSTQAELMTGCNKIVCDKCTSGNEDGKSVYTNSTKQTLISHAPPVLVIHLKRFHVQMMSCRKLSRHVSFPFQLDLTPYSIPIVQLSQENECTKVENKPNLLYTLYGVVEHSGTMNGGHYVAYVKVIRNNATLWYRISDSHVSQVTENIVLSAQAYLLFYKRITPT